MTKVRIERSDRVEVGRDSRSRSFSPRCDRFRGVARSPDDFADPGPAAKSAAPGLIATTVRISSARNTDRPIMSTTVRVPAAREAATSGVGVGRPAPGRRPCRRQPRRAGQRDQTPPPTRPHFKRSSRSSMPIESRKTPAAPCLPRGARSSSRMSSGVSRSSRSSRFGSPPPSSRPLRPPSGVARKTPARTPAGTACRPQEHRVRAAVAALHHHGRVRGADSLASTSSASALASGRSRVKDEQRHAAVPSASSVAIAPSSWALSPWRRVVLLQHPRPSIDALATSLVRRQDNRAVAGRVEHRFERDERKHSAFAGREQSGEPPLRPPEPVHGDEDGQPVTGARAAPRGRLARVPLFAPCSSSSCPSRASSSRALPRRGASVPVLLVQHEQVDQSLRKSSPRRRPRPRSRVLSSSSPPALSPPVPR